MESTFSDKIWKAVRFRGTALFGREDENKKCEEIRKQVIDVRIQLQLFDGREEGDTAGKGGEEREEEGGKHRLERLPGTEDQDGKSKESVSGDGAVEIDGRDGKKEESAHAS